LTTIRKKQLKIFHDLTRFEQRILCHKLPKSFDCIKVEYNEQQSKNKRNKMIQEFKRQMLNVKIEQYEIKIQDYEHLYQQELSAFELQLLQRECSRRQNNEMNMIINCIKAYLNHQTNKSIRRIRYQESCFRIKLLRDHRYRGQHYPLSEQESVHVYPQIIIDGSKVLLNRIQLDYLSYNGKYKILLYHNFIYQNSLSSNKKKMFSSLRTKLY